MPKLQVIADVVINHKQKELILRAIKECTDATLKEPGCESYQAYISNAKPDRVVFIETWTSKDALNLHLETEHFKKLVATVSPHLVRGFEVEELTEI